MRNSLGRFAAGAVVVLLVGVLSVSAQVQSVVSSEKCDRLFAEKKKEWGKTEHTELANAFHKESVEMEDRWCRIPEAEGYGRVNETVDFGRTLFTGEGLHPTVGNIVPGGGFAGGLAFNLPRNFQEVRSATKLEARGSSNGFWEAGGLITLTGSSNVPDNRHIYATLDIIHQSLPQLTYYGLGNSSSLANQTVYALQDTNAGANLFIPLPKLFRVFGGVTALHASPGPSFSAGTPSIGQVFTPANTPAINTTTTYVIYGGGIEWPFPVEERTGDWYQTSFQAQIRRFQEVGGSPYSFGRVDVGWTQLLHLFPKYSHEVGTVSLVGQLVESLTSSGNQVPFYLQPTIGGTNIDNEETVRSYRDYRYRAPNTLLFQAEFTRTIYDPFGFLFFYDVGKVALQPSDLGITNMRHSFGVGFTVKAGAMALFKLYYAWAEPEGTHTNYTGNTNNFKPTENNMNGVFCAGCP